MNAEPLGMTRDQLQEMSDLLIKTGKALKRASSRSKNSEVGELVERILNMGWRFDSEIDALAPAVPA